MLDIILIISMGCLVLAVGVYTVLLFIGKVAGSVNVGRFKSQITKLVMANNIDRAIKLCNAVPTAYLPKGVKIMLLRANRLYSMELAYEEAKSIFETSKGRPKLAYFVPFLSYAACAAALFFATNSESTRITLVAGLLLLWVLHAVQIKILLGMQQQMMEGLESLLEIRNLLYYRAKNGSSGTDGFYLPPHLAPRKMRREDLDEWWSSMERFESDLSDRRKSGEDFDPNEEYDKKSNADGVLPAI